MVRVAIAGGTNGLGRSVTEAIAAFNKHQVFVLSRGGSDLYINDPSITVLVLDYSNVTAIASILKTHQINTIFSCLALRSEEDSQAQLNLIEGAALSQTVARFAPSDFGMDYVEANKKNYPFPGIALRVAAIEKLRTFPSLTYTRFIMGTFMDYFGAPLIPTYLRTISLVLDMENGKAVIPGDGNVPVVLTHTSTIGSFLAASLDLETWPEASIMVGERMTLNELVAVAESVKGSKFDVTYDTIEDMNAGKNTELANNIPRYSTLPKFVVDKISRVFGDAAAKGYMNLAEANLNALLPEVKPHRIVEGMLERKCLSLQIRALPKDLPCMRINREAHEVGAKRYKIAFEKNLHNPIYFDFRHDALLFKNGTTFNNFIETYDIVEPTDRVRTIGLRCTIDREYIQTHASGFRKMYRRAFTAVNMFNICLEEFSLVLQSSPKTAKLIRDNFMDDIITLPGPEGWEVL